MKEPGAGVSFHIPIKLRITGELTDDQLELLGETLARTLQTRLALAERTLRTRYGLSAAGADLDVREAYDGARGSEDEGSYLIPSYDTGGQTASVTIRAPGRSWIILKAINFHAFMSQFFDFAASVSGQQSLPGADLYFEVSGDLRWVTLWYIQVNEEVLLSALGAILSKRAKELERQPADQPDVWALIGTEALREDLIKIDEDHIVAREMPKLTRDRKLFSDQGTDILVRPGARLLFAQMVLPKIELKDRAELNAEIQLPLRMRDLTFLVNPVAFDRFEHRFALPWADYLREFGDQPITVHLLPVTIRKRTHIFTLEPLLERLMGRHLDETATSRSETFVCGRLDILNSATLAQFPTAVRDAARHLTNDVTLGLDAAQTKGYLEPNWKLAHIYSRITVRSRSVEVARYRPQAASVADHLMPGMSERIVTVKEVWAFRDFMKQNFGVLFPVPFEVLLDELKGRENGRWFDRLFEAAQEVKDYEIRLLIIRLAKQTKYADSPQVLELVAHHNKIEHTRVTGNVYDVEHQKIILDKLFGDVIVSYHDILHEVWDPYIHEEKRYRPKSAYAAKWEKALLEEAIALIGRIERGEDPTGNGKGYSEEEFAEAVLKAVFSRLNITKDNFGDYFDTITVELSVRFLGLRKTSDELGIETTWVSYQVVERENGGPWKDVGKVEEVSESRFDYMIDQWIHEHVASIVIGIAYVSVAIAAVAVAWEYGVISVLVDIAGGTEVVVTSIVLSTIYEVIVHGFTFESFLMGAINGYLGALFFKGAGLLTRGLFGSSITSLSLRQGVVRWIGTLLFRGALGGGTSAAAMRFAHDVYLIATGRGTWSTPEQYAESVGYGTAIGIGMEFAGPLVLEPVMARIGGGAMDVVRLLRANGITPARWQEWAEQALTKTRQNLAALMEQQPGKAATISDGLGILYKEISDTFAGLGRGIRQRAEASITREVGDIAKPVRPEPTAEQPGIATKGEPGTATKAEVAQPANAEEARMVDAGRGDAPPSAAQLESEFEIVSRSRTRRVSDDAYIDDYVEEVELSNGHIWRRTAQGNKWCRFSDGGPFCIVFGEGPSGTGHHIEEFPSQRKPRRGEWSGTPGDSDFTPNDPAVLQITNYQPVPFRKGLPDFSAWAEETVILGRAEYGTLGRDAHNLAADTILAQRRGWQLPNGEPDVARATAYRQNNLLTWHHVPGQPGVTLELLPRLLHEVAQHVGGFSELQGGP